MLWGPGILSFVVAFAALRLLIGPLARLALDEPNERSLHQRPVPRTGGVAVIAGTAAGLYFVEGAYWPPLIIALVLAGVSLLDDLRGMPTPVRLTAHLAAAAVLVWHLAWPMDPVAAVLLVLAVTWITNLYNFMDGSDGLAGGMAVIGFGVYAYAAYLAGNAWIPSFCVALAGDSLLSQTLSRLLAIAVDLHGCGGCRTKSQTNRRASQKMAKSKRLLE
jgi:UDP-N-acetylmuramyl pentapeptide phosphotransferase/UDP-N-acetylglucosamine-1-phosphate transferase